MLFPYKMLITSFVLIVAFAVSGCGEKTVVGSSVSKQDDSQNCLVCHDSASKVTGKSIKDEYFASSHYTENKASCADCHEPHQSHPDAGNCSRCHGGSALSGADVTLNADEAGKCGKCHTSNGGFGISVYNDITRDTGPLHFNTISSTSYVNSQNVGKCRNCHNPHDTKTNMDVFRAWSRSGHGATKALPWSEDNFKTKQPCNRCHTTTGFIKFITTGDSSPWGSADDKTKEVLECRGCHATYDHKNSTRKVVAFVAPYGASSTVPNGLVQDSFPDVGESNICIPCHSGRENGASLMANSAVTASSSAKTAHYLAAAAVFYGKGGFQFYTSGVRYNTYGAAGKVGQNANWSHGRLGMDNYVTTTDATIKASGAIINSGNKGQCIACHLGTKNNHAFSALETANATQAGTVYTQGCYGCHNGITGVSNSQGEMGMTMAEFIEEEKIIWERMFDYYTWQLAQYGIYFHDNGFYTTATGTTSFKNWGKVVGTTFGGAGTSEWQKTMGTAMNLHLLVNEKGSFMHNRSFGRALISDSLTWLQKGADGINADRAQKFSNPNLGFKFSDYSTAVTTTYAANGVFSPEFSAAKPVSISTLKSYLFRVSGGKYTRR